MKVALVRQQLRGRDVQYGDSVMGGIGDDRIAGWVVMGRRPKRVEVRKYRLAELDGVRCRRKVCNVDVTKIRREHERVVLCCGLSANLAVTCALVGSISALSGSRGAIDQRAAVPVVGKLKVILRVVPLESNIRGRRTIAY